MPEEVTARSKVDPTQVRAELDRDSEAQQQLDQLGVTTWTAHPSRGYLKLPVDEAEALIRRLRG